MQLQYLYIILNNYLFCKYEKFYVNIFLLSMYFSFSVCKYLYIIFSENKNKTNKKTIVNKLSLGLLLY